MILRRFFYAFNALAIINICTSLPAQTPQIVAALNLHQSLTPHDINGLGKDQRVKALLDVQTTIDEVQKLLNSDPSLPRLTKGEIKDLFEKVTTAELEKSIVNGDIEKQELMKNLILALPYHSEELAAIENLARQKATTKPPNMELEIPEDLKQLLKGYGLLNEDEKSIGLAPLPVHPIADSPSSLLLKNNKNTQPLTLEELAEYAKKASLVEAKDYEAFKPILNDGKNVTSDMEDFFKQFGLGGSRTDRKKSPSKDIKNYTSSIPSIESSYLMPSYSKLLSNIGITTIDDEKSKKHVKKTSTNVVKPANMKAQGDDYKKLEQILDTIKELERLNSTQTSTSSSNLDPVKYNSRTGPRKNGVKRQQESDEPTKLSLALDQPLLESSLEATEDDTSTSTTTEAVTTTTTKTTTESSDTSSSTTEEEKKNSLEDEIEPIDEIEQLPSPRRSGFYMLFDWNSFLEVGEDPSKIIVRFDPKIGDPTRFLPVTIP